MSIRDRVAEWIEGIALWRSMVILAVGALSGALYVLLAWVAIWEIYRMTITGYGAFRKTLNNWYSAPMHLSHFERWRNRALLFFFLIALIYAFLEHVVLANIPEVFPGGARTGEVFYELGIAYIVAYAFYLLSVALPLQRDRRNVYRNLRPLVDRVFGQAIILMRTVNLAANLEPYRENTQSNVEETCGAVGPRSRAPILMQGPSGGGVQGTAMDVIRSNVLQTRQLIGELLNMATYLDSELIKHVSAIANCKYFQLFDNVGAIYAYGGNTDMSPFATPIFDYLLLIDRLDEYRRSYLPPNQTDPELITGTGRRSQAIPLHREMRFQSDGQARLPKKVRLH